jgi:hypothetical protein
LSEIFTLLPTSSESTFSRWDATFILGAVCSHWRKLALSTPRLWCTIYVNLDRGDSESKADMVRTWLERSGHCPLSIGLRAEERDCGDHPVLDLVIQNSHRLQAFDIFLSCTSMGALAPLRGQLPILQSLVLGDPGAGFESIESSFKVFADAPHLHILDLGPAYNLGIFDLPFAQIIQCSTTDFATDECLDVLRMTPNAKAYEFKGMYEAMVPSQSPVVSHLHSLSIAQSSHDLLDLGQIFGLLTLPSIRELSLHHRRPHVWSQPKFMSFVARSSCRLAKLVLIRISLSNGDLMCVLEAMPSLCELEVGAEDFQVDTLYYIDRVEDPPYKSPVDDTTLQKLTYHSGSSGQLPPAPSLHTVRFWGNHNFEDHSLLSMVESRWSGTLPEGLERLRSVHIKLHREFAPQTMARVEVLEEQGLDITFKTSSDCLLS